MGKIITLLNLYLVLLLEWSIVVGKVDDNTSVIDKNVTAEKSDNAFVIHIVLVLLLT